MLAGLVLAGGQSRRMGVDKSGLRLPSKKQSLLEHAQSVLQVLCGNAVYVSSNQEQQGIADIVADCGPLSGIHAALYYLKKHNPTIDELLVVPVDMPALTPADLRYILEAGRAGQTLCCFEDCFLPVYIPLNQYVDNYLTQLLSAQPHQTPVNKRQYSIKNMLSALSAVQIKPPPDTQLNNINTSEQWQQHCAEHHSKKVNT